MVDAFKLIDEGLQQTLNNAQYEEMSQLLEARKALQWIVDNEHRSPTENQFIFRLIYQNLDSITAEWLDKVSLNLSEQEGDTKASELLNTAINNGRIQTVKKLIQLGCRPNTQTLINCILHSPLNQKYEIVELLLEKHGQALSQDPNIIESIYNTLTNVNNNRILELLVDHSMNFPPEMLLHAAKSGNLSLVKKMIDQGMDPLVTNAQGKTVLDFALEGDSPAVFNYFVHVHNMKPAANSLQIAVGANAVRCARLLMDTGFVVDPAVEAAVEIAFRHYNPETTRLLLEKGHLKEKLKDILFGALQYGQDNLALLSLQLGAETSMTEHQGRRGYITKTAGDMLRNRALHLPPIDRTLEEAIELEAKYGKEWHEYAIKRDIQRLCEISMPNSNRSHLLKVHMLALLNMAREFPFLRGVSDPDLTTAIQRYYQSVRQVVANRAVESRPEPILPKENASSSTAKTESTEIEESSKKQDNTPKM